MGNRKIQLQPKESSEPLKSSDTSKPGKQSSGNSLNMMGKSGGSLSDVPLTQENMIYLQRSIGNRAVTRLVQTKLNVSQPGDAYEREADEMADQVMRMPEEANKPQPAPVPEEEKRKKPEQEGAVQMKRASGTIQRQAMPAQEEESKKRGEG